LQFKPQLAAREIPASLPDYFERLIYPLYGSPKLDGIRACVGDDMVVYSRTMKPLRSYQVQEEFGALKHFDGELTAGEPTEFNVYNKTSSHVMSFDKPGDIRYYVFDHSEFPEWEYEARLGYLADLIEKLNDERVILLGQQLIENEQELLACEDEYLKMGFEGMMLRSITAPYKHGRCTFNEGILMKLKRAVDTEGLVVGIEPWYINTNKQERDELGYAKRSKTIDGREAIPRAGTFIVELEDRTKERVGPGNFTHDELDEIWELRDVIIGSKYLKFRHFPHGTKDQMRHARAIGFRDLMDM
jgi:DNA ligase 1